ncbi:hypothetical protein [Microbacterium lushaniae]|uniref:Uncharacterized protein n=1 Tax=Microbacterium lushaniae TaxID=2614639 RepID=A0A5J6L0E9_9MICO|nr:hypothetical protein [Microbacterium lushaniae]QEW01974.1 hypothetical protein F6J85_01915 [Microbacterium lushaniae]
MLRPRLRPAPRAQQHRRASAPVRMLLAALGTAGAIILGIVAGSGTFAAWASSAPAAGAVTVTAGSAALSLTPLSLTATDLYPGKTVYAATTVRNAGTTPLALAVQASSAAATPFTSALVVSAGSGTAANCTAGRVAPTVTTPLGAPATLAQTLAPGTTATLCIGVGLPVGAPAAAAGAAAGALSITVSGSQVSR